MPTPDRRLELVAGFGKDHVIVHEALVADPALLAKKRHLLIQRRDASRTRCPQTRMNAG